MPSESSCRRAPQSAEALFERGAPVAAQLARTLGHVLVLERQLHAVVHLEAALRLADEAQIGVVHHQVDVGQLELRADGELLHHELEVVVS